MDYTIKIGGEAGQGIQTVGNILMRVFVGAGYHAFSHQDYESRVRGGHNFYQIRLANKPIYASRNKIDILVALDRESVKAHEHELSSRGTILYDASACKFTRESYNFLDIPFEEMAKASGKDKILSTAVAIGAVLAKLEMELNIYEKVISDTFGEMGALVIEENKNAALAGYDYVRQHSNSSFVMAAKTENKRLLIGGSESIAAGALASGCKFYSAYPMTPSTGIMNYLAEKEVLYGVVIEQAEDEIAAINMVLGASYAGVRAMTGTSGGGFALMTEGLSLAGITETPIVIAMGQRPGPATGLPTRTEQGDLDFLISAGHGEFPRVVFAPGNPCQAYYLTSKAFDIAEKYQIPVFILFDTYLADSLWTFEPGELKHKPYQDYRLRGDAFKNQQDYKRYLFSDSGISPLAVPGDAHHVVVVDSDEHDEEGHLVEDAATRVKMVEKRLFKKMPLIKSEMAPPEYYGTPEAQVLLTGWGTTYGVMKEAVDQLAESMSIAMLHFSEVYPLPDTDRFDYLSILKKSNLPICIELNATGQFSRLLRAETGFLLKAFIHSYDGRPFTTEELIGEINGHLGNV